MPAWDVNGGSYSGLSVGVGSQEATPQAVTFKSDGSKMYVIGSTNDTIYQYSLSTAWDVSSATYDSVSFSTATQDTNPQGMAWKPDGTAFVVMGRGTGYVYQYSCLTAWVVSSASYASKRFRTAAQYTFETGVFWHPDGTSIYVLGFLGVNTFEIGRFPVSTAWDVSTATVVGETVYSIPSTTDTDPQDLFFSDDGTRLYFVGMSNDRIYQREMSTAWDVTTATGTTFLSVGSEDTVPRGLAFSADGTKAYIVGDTNNTIYQYDLPPAVSAVSGFLVGAIAIGQP